MSEAFHQWVHNMPWWERLYYELFDPQAITCSTYPVAPAWPFLVIIVVVAVIGLILLCFSRKPHSKPKEPAKDTRHYRCFCGKEFEGRALIVNHMNTEHTVKEVYQETERLVIF